jgi:MFS family permease
VPKVLRALPWRVEGRLDANRAWPQLPSASDQATRLRPKRHSLRDNLRQLPPTAWILFIGTFINRFGSFVIVFLVLYLTARGFTPQQAGAAVSLYGLGGLLASLVGGQLADRIGRARTIMLSMFGSAAVMLTLSQVHLLAIILLLALLAGLTSEAYRPASAALLADLVPAGRRVPAFAALRFAVNAGYALGAATAGLLAQRSFILVFLLDAVTSLIFGILALAAIRESGVSSPAGEHVWLRSYGRILADRTFLLFLLAAFLVGLVYLQSFSTFPLEVRALRLSGAVYGGLMSLNGLMIVFSELPLSALTQHRSPRGVIALGFFLIGLGFAFLAFVHALALLVFAVVVWTFGEMLSSPMAAAYVADRAPIDLRGRYQGAWGWAWSFGLILGPIIGTSFFTVNARGFWLLCGFLGAVGASLVLISGQVEGTRRPVPLRRP